MQASRRWREWHPPEKFQECSQQEVPKVPELQPEHLLSPLALPTLAISKTFNSSDSVLPHDPAEWRKPFARWLDCACVRSLRCFGGVGCLHIAYCEWEVGQGGVPCTRETFERLLTERGFLMGEVAGVVLVSGVAFRSDLETYQ
jgi:hypothetical protein